MKNNILTLIQPNNNENILPELEESSTSDNEISLPTSDNSPIEPNNPQIELDNLLSEITDSIKVAEMTEEGIIDDSEVSDNEEYWSNVVEN
ncbi:11169_t:CDS:2 [Scutellospora calospora]|uniref:11169_t:CDS:1 n=1 Tax=Scutellospora calospora TaxID=85575 RepID=A0ACA9L316_9GLOM|nr:11169_t:CDS:2 [Scutellospora calospora]